MNTTQLTDDPTGNRYIYNRLSSLLLIEAEHTIQNILAETIDPNYAIALFLQYAERTLDTYIQLSIQRGAAWAGWHLTRNPEIRFSYSPYDRWISDIKLKNELITEAMETINKSINKILQQKPHEILESVKKVSSFITMKALNITTSERMKAVGVETFTYIAHIDACTDPKKHPSGAPMPNGCMGMHGKRLQIEDLEKFLPPAHPYCRCTIIPDF